MICLIVISVVSCKTIPPHKIAFKVVPEKGALCQLVDKKGETLKDPICYPVDHKDVLGQYIFLKYGGYHAISMQAVKELLLKKEGETE